MLALYLRNLVNDAWSMAWDHHLLITTIDVSCNEAERLRSDPPVDPVADLAWRLLDFMRLEFRVETALLAGRLDAVLRVAEAAAAHVRPIVDAARECPPGRVATRSCARPPTS
ncbi:hypothetical protein G7085_13290 [Tessaracoccus sp. HDW20]|uniref:hypothetical protein n=1 Tax=Tessaracoccus coleopterorum TaxID=2714950 RepID=UPI0018D35D16|nr:hypothetical protein [Tessaracoccus coleopterorum]NHB85280.1 hypothetical protein [Tessaracoccus coleopterorum]